ncbi:MAG: type II CRISPR RNA-guided endonuclease Cas9 [Mediterranea sp.]|jgi:CRISPR-associated endonuclease Csn1|nr:type II CRISPR RNA-guided endonuclease Cas9 [Mediterranea sp.]
MKKILGLDLGTNSIGWAVVNQAENDNEKSSIVKLGVRVNPLTVDEQQNFEKGKSITTNADRTLKRSMRRNLQRYKLRRENLLEVLKEAGFISSDTILSEEGNRTTFQTYRLRAKAATEEVSLEELACILLMINKKRGYTSGRKVDSGDEGQLIDGMAVAKQLYEGHLTPGQLSYSLLKQGKKRLPDFYRSDLQAEMDAIWNFQSTFYPEILTDEFKVQLSGRGKQDTTKVFLAKYHIYTADNKGKDKRIQSYRWRVDALSKQLSQEELAFVISDVNGNINNSSGYLGAISDRSKTLFFHKQTVGQYLMEQLDRDPNVSLKNQVFYRQDYLDEFERIWETQAHFHKELTSELKQELRDIVIFYQRPLKSQKGLIAFCEFENREVKVIVDGKEKVKTRGLRVCPKSSLLYQDFKIWQVLNNLRVMDKGCVNSEEGSPLNQEEKEILYQELSVKEKLTKADALKLLYTNHKALDLNYKDIEGNRTQAALFKAYQQIIESSGHNNLELSKMKASDAKQSVEKIFSGLGYNTDILSFDSSLEGKALEEQPSYRLWHLLYSFEGDDSLLGNEKLVKKLSECFGFEEEYAKILAGVTFQPDYGSLSAKAIRRILSYMKEGTEYSLACQYAGYRHSKESLTVEELERKEYKDKLDILPKNSLRNPVVEKILNQMIHVVNGVVDTYGKPDEIHIELARELKANAKEREERTNAINKTTVEHEEYRKKLQQPPFNLIHVSRNDIVRYKLYLELKSNGYKTLYSDTYIPAEKLFSKEFDIEHIIPQARLFDDSFSNKTLESRSINIEKSNSTAYDYIEGKYGEEGVQTYTSRVNKLYADGAISKTKRNKLLMKQQDIPEDFLQRDLRDSQYIAKKARLLLSDLVKTVVPTSGSITARLREDWQLVDVMQELDWDKYDKRGLTEIIEDKDGRKIRRIKEWTKRNDHRHHAMDALTIAFTNRSIIQYLNNLNARSDKGGSIYVIEKKELYRDSRGKLRFNPPIPLNDFRAEAKRKLENILVSIKAKNKVVTPNTNVTKNKGGKARKVQLTPRGQLHNETIYGSIQQYATSLEKVGGNFDEVRIATVASKKYRVALMGRLLANGGNPKKAFTGSNSLEKNPLYIDKTQTVKVPSKVKTVCQETVYTIRKAVSPDLKVEKVIDAHIRQLLKARLAEYEGDPRKAFSNLDEHPIWLNEEKGISIKRVTITGISNAVPLHDKHDHNGALLLDEEGKKQPVDFVSTGNNHHVAIYRDANGELQESIVSFFEATTRASLGLPIVDKAYKAEEGWTFLFTMKQNEYFVFPNEEAGFHPNEIDLTNPENYARISPNLFRVQKLASKDYTFRHHLETSVEDVKELRDITWKRIQSLDKLENLVKVRVNHLGDIVAVGEYQ